MKAKRKTGWTVLVLVSLLMGISSTTSDWVGCEQILPDEYMHLSLETQQGAQRSIFQRIHLINAFSLPCLAEWLSIGSIYPYFEKVSPHLEQPLTVIQRI
jgi:hypothetical protein